jgi:hypothetical protein
MTDAQLSAGRLPGWWQQLVFSQRREVCRILRELASARGIMP